MIYVLVEKLDYQYDIHSLFSAFFPGNQVKVVTNDDYEKALEKEKIHIRKRKVSTGNENISESDQLAHSLYSLSWNENTMALSCLDDEASFLCSKLCKEIADGIELREKDLLKLFIYQVLEERIGKSLPWGNMIGVRPVKLASKMLEEGCRNSQIAVRLRSHHRVSDRKTILAVEIANREADVLCRIAGIDNEQIAAGSDRKAQLEQVTKRLKQGISVYVGVPFCPTTCLYCSFTSYPICAYKNQVGAYLDALKKEISQTADIYNNRIIDTIYIGGGTPTALDEEAFEDLLKFVTTQFDFSHVKEFTVEAGRADSITEKKLQLMKDYGVTRISVNPQTMKQSTLNLIGRAATVDATVAAFKLARKVGHDNINMDLILGLPGESVEDVKETLKLVGELDPDSVTVHSLAIKKASRLYRVLEQGLKNGQVYRDTRTGAIWTVPKGDTGNMQSVSSIEDLLPKADEVNNAMEYTYEITRQWEQYPYYLYRQKQMSGSLENVGFAKPGKEGLYNILMMEEQQDILAFGPGTVSKRLFDAGRIERCDNVKDIDLYMSNIDEMIDRKKQLFLQC